MLGISERQQIILEKVVEKYIRDVQPVSSDCLKEQGGFAVCPATIRLDLAKLTEQGFLEKTHISGGRVPTDKGYRFFVNRAFKRAEGKRAKRAEREEGEWQNLFSGFDDFFKLTHQLTEKLSRLSANLAVGELKGFFWEEGWLEAVKAPEFKNIDYFKQFLKAVNDFENNLEKIDFSAEEKVKVFIGQESPFEEKGFSLLVAKARPAEQEEATLALLGPKRMDFEKNFDLLSGLISALEEL